VHYLPAVMVVQFVQMRFELGDRQTLKKFQQWVSDNLKKS